MRLLPTAVEEMLRYVSPVIYMRRTAMRDTELGGKKIKAGDKVAMYYGSANRDESMFPNPDKFDVGRTPNEHIAFGGGDAFLFGLAYRAGRDSGDAARDHDATAGHQAVGPGGVPGVELHLRTSEDAGPLLGEKSLVLRGRGICDERLQPIDIDRLYDVVIEPGRQCAPAILILSIPGERDQAHALRSGQGANVTRQRVAVHPGQPDVNEDHVKRVLGKDVQRDETIGRDAHLVTEQLQQHVHAFGRVGIVFHNQNARTCLRGLRALAFLVFH